jgi:uncharacterized integral membrane protein
MKLYAILALLLLVVILTAQNYQVMEIQVFFWTVAASRAIVLFLTLLVGMLIGWLGAQFQKKKQMPGPETPERG